MSHSGIVFRRPQHYRTMEHYRFPSINQRFPKRFYDYFPQQNIGLPRAPAFRLAKKKSVDEMIERICRPAVCRSSRAKEKHKITYDSNGAKVYGNQKVSSEEMGAITSRLLKGSKCKRKCHKQHEEKSLVLPPLKI